MRLVVDANVGISAPIADSKTCDSEVVPAREFYPSIGAAEAAIGETDPDGLFTLRVRSPPTRPSWATTLISTSRLSSIPIRQATYPTRLRRA